MYNKTYIMNRKAKKRALRIRLTVIYGSMVLAVILLVAGTYMVIQGYRFNRFDGKVEQGGLVQFNSVPTGADVWLDQTRLASKTQSKLTVSAGSHDVSMQRAGYHSWNKAVKVFPGTILWLDYVRLVPTSLSPQLAAPLAGVGSAKVSYDAKTFAIIQIPAEPVITLVGVDSTEPVARQVSLPVTAFTPPAETETQTFELHTWAYDNRSVLIKHTYGNQVEWISFNVADGKTANNLTKVLGIDAVDVQYSREDTNTLFMLTATNEVRRTNINQKTVSGPLLHNVNEFNMYDNDTIVFSSRPDATTGMRMAGYLTANSATPRAVYQSPAGDSAALHMAINKYIGKNYIAVTHGGAVMVYAGDLAASDTVNPAPFVQIEKIDAKFPVESIGFSPGQRRFMYAVGGSQITTYDLDLGLYHQLTLQAPLHQPVNWIDDFHFVTSVGSTLSMYDYDGTNGHDIMGGAVTGEVSLSQSGRYFNAITQVGDTVGVSRVRMIID